MVEVDGARFATLPAEAVVELGLRKGLELDDGRFRKLQHAADLEAVRRVALRLLAACPRAVDDLLQRLRQRGLNPAAVAEVVGRLEEQGVLDDAEFARHFVRVRSSRGHGPARLLTDLLAHGVARRAAQRAIDQVLDAEGVDPLGQARAVAVRRARQLGDLPPAVKRRRMLAYLERRGFRGWEVREMVAELLRDPE